MKRFGILFLFLLFTLGGGLMAQTLVSEKFDDTHFSFSYVFKNDTKKEIHLDSIGAVIQVKKGIFSCSGKEALKTPIADFVFPFKPKNATIYLPKYPDINIAPGETKEFSLAFLPDVTKACSDWAFEVKVMLNFNTGTPFYSTPKLLIKDNYFAYGMEQLPDDEIQKNIYSNDEGLRIKALNSLEKSNISDDLKIRFIKFALENSSDKIKMPAIMAIYNSHLNAMADYLNSLVYSSLPYQDKKVLVYVLGRLDFPKTVNSLIGLLLNGDPRLMDVSVNSLVALGRGDVKAKVGFMLNKHMKWVKMDVKHTERLLGLIKVLVQYHDNNGLQIIKKILQNEATPAFKRSLLTYLDGYYQRGDESDKNYIAGIGGDVFKDLVNLKDPVSELHAMNLFMSTSSDVKAQKKIIKKLLRSKNFDIQYQASVWVGRKGFREFASEALKVCSRIEENESNFGFFQALRKMKEENKK